MKTLLLVGAAMFLLAAPAFSRAEETETALDVSALTTVSAPIERRAVTRTRDGDVNTYTVFAPNEPYTCVWTAEAEIRGVSIQWFAPPDSVILVQTDDTGAELSRETVASPLYNDFYPLLAAARSLTLYAEGGMQIAEAAFYTAGTLPDGVYDWQPPAQKADLLVVAAHCDDELLFFGGTIPYYAGERGLRVQVVYMANGDRLRVDEALAGLWHCGVKNAPVFLPLPDYYTEALKNALIRWDENTVTETLVSLIRRFQPEVIVTHDLNGEYGHGAHMATAYCVQKAVPLAADAAQYPDSGEAFGAWQTQKLYLHLYPESAITMDWSLPLAAFDGKTALEVANEAYHLHTSQLEYHKNVYGAGDYSSTDYGLAYSAVGADVAKDDFFEHIDPARLTNYVLPEASETPQITAKPTTAPAKETPQPPAGETETPDPALPVAAIAGFAAALTAAIASAIVIKRRKKRKTGV